MMRAIVAVMLGGLLAVGLSGCASMADAGIARYTVEPYYDTVQQVWVCCRASVISGKNVQSVHVTASKAADVAYRIDLTEQGIDGSAGQKIASQTATDVAGVVSKAAVSAATSILK